MLTLLSGERCILGGKKAFVISDFRSEAQLESLVLKNRKSVFGPYSVYLPVREKLSTPYSTRFSDGLLLDVSDLFDPRSWIVEFELSTHDPYKVIEPQLRGFLRALKSEETLGRVRSEFYREIQTSKAVERNLARCFGPRQDLYYLLDRIIHGRMGILVIIDKLTPPVTALVQELSKEIDVRVVEFTKYRLGKELLFECTPLLPQSRLKWYEQMISTTPGNRDLLRRLLDSLNKELGKYYERPTGRYLTLYSSEDINTKRLFLAIILQKNAIHLRVGTADHDFKDPKGVTRQYKGGWFFRRLGRTERGFEISAKEELEYATRLVSQSYALAGGALQKALG